MSVTTQALLFPRLQPGLQATQTPRCQGATHLIPIESPASSDTIVHVVCNDAEQIANLMDILSSHAIRVKVFRTATEYITNAGSDQIACVILDLNLPDINGLEVQRMLSESGGPPVVFVTAHGDLNSGVCAMKNGAIDFMIEPIDYNRLLAAVETAFARDRRNRHKRVERLSLLTRWNSLTPREQDVFEYIVAGFLNKQGAAELGIAENTFQVHRGRVMRKMKADSLADLVRMSTRFEPLLHSLGQSETLIQTPRSIPDVQLRECSKALSESSDGLCNFSPMELVQYGFKSR
jgi:FixJ family two-component response regulator